MKTETMMNRSNMMRIAIRVAGLAFILSLVATPMITLADESDGRREQTASTRADLSAARIVEMRNSLYEATDILYAIGEQSAIARTMASATQARDALDRMTDDEVAQFADAMPQIEQLVYALRNAQSLSELAAMNREVTSRLAQSHPEIAGTLPGGGYSSECGNSRDSTTLVRGFLIALQVGRGVHAALDRVCSQVVAGFNGTLACLVSDLVLVGLQSAYEQLVFCVEDIDSAEILGAYDRLGHVHEHLESAQSGVFTEGSASSSLWFNKTLIIGARDSIITEIQSTGDAVVSAIEEFAAKIQAMIQVGFDEQNLVLRGWRIDSLRLWIEADLGRETGSDRIAQFQLPEAVVCELPDIPCGCIERVIKIVLETISAMETVGQPTYGAQEVFEQGVAQYTAGNYKDAYGLLVQAYLLATDLQEDTGATSRGGREGGSASRR